MRRRLLASTAVLLAVSASVGMGSAAQARTAPSSSSGPVCPAPPLVASTASTCSFDDEFNGNRLNTNLWRPTTTASDGFRVGPECYINDSSTISVAGGSLHLRTNQLSQPMTCTGPNGGSFQTSYTSGMVSSRGKFQQTYGHFEIRARFPNVTVPGTDSALWLYPASLSSAGEIDMVEHYSYWPTRGVSSLVYPNPQGRAVSQNCTFADPGAFHTYSLDWTPTSMTFTYDQTPCWTTGWTPEAPLTGSEPFNQPVFLCLTEAMGTSFNSYVAGSAPMPMSMDIDYVRVWR
ncbi:MAG: glycoside hydrolase family 16 protein [Marmoricola sp.]